MKTFVSVLLVISSLGLSGATPSIPDMRMTPTEVMSGDKGDSQIGSSKLAGVHTKVLYGNPAASGFYSILLFVPAHTSIQAHSHRDNRMATVVSGTWQFGYGKHFNEAQLKSMPPGSVYSEPAGADHFARTTDLPAVVHICGYGPTDTHYFDPANAPDSHGKK